MTRTSKISVWFRSNIDLCFDMLSVSGNSSTKHKNKKRVKNILLDNNYSDGLKLNSKSQGNSENPVLEIIVENKKKSLEFKINIIE